MLKRQSGRRVPDGHQSHLCELAVGLLGEIPQPLGELDIVGNPGCLVGNEGLHTPQPMLGRLNGAGPQVDGLPVSGPIHEQDAEGVPTVAPPALVPTKTRHDSVLSLPWLRDRHNRQPQVLANGIESLHRETSLAVHE